MRNIQSLLHRLRTRLAPWVPPVVLALVWAFHVDASLTWLRLNPLPNGYQNEILHLGNALDIYVVFQFENWRLLHDFLFKGYWPPLIYVLSLVPVGILGPSRDTFVSVGFGFLALLMGATFALGRRLFSPGVGLLAAVLVSFFPSIYGNVVRFEPNVALAATTTAGLLALARSQSFGRWAPSLAFGAISGAGMLVDRLAYAFFVWAPAGYELVRGALTARGSPTRRDAVLRHVVWSGVALLVVAGYYHSFFFAIHSEEIFSQAAQGEIIETGELTERRDPLSPLTWAFYPLTLADSQVGPAVMALLAVPLLLGLWGARGRGKALVPLWLLGALLLFTLVQKKQVFYTIPVLPAVAILAAAGLLRVLPAWIRGPWVALTLLLAVNQHQALLTGRGFLPEVWTLNVAGRLRSLDLRAAAGVSPLPEAWVGPRYPQARPPDGEDLRLDEIRAVVDELRGGLPVFRIGTYSEDGVFFEGYLTFFVRAANPFLRVNGLLENLQAFYEWARLMDLFIYVTPVPGRVWPTATSVDDTLESFHRQDDAWPMGELMEDLEARYTLRRSLRLSTGATVYFYTPAAPVDAEPTPPPAGEGGAAP